jgi:hypothetical protein
MLVVKQASLPTELLSVMSARHCNWRLAGAVAELLLKEVTSYASMQANCSCLQLEVELGKSISISIFNFTQTPLPLYSRIISLLF